MRALLLITVLFLVGCVEQGSNPNRTTGTAQIDKTADEIYDKLMGKILNNKLSHAGNGSHFRAGMKNPYRKGLSSSHKALAACLAWDADKRQVTSKYSYSQPSGDWGYAEIGALNGCESQKLQKSLNCKCQTLDHDDVNVLQIPSNFRIVYENGLKKTPSQQPNTTSNEMRYYLDVAWEKLLQKREVYAVIVKQKNRVGHVKSASLIGGKKCDATFRFDKAGKGDWEVICRDGTRAVGVLQTQGRNKGSKGTGFDTAGNKVSFSIIPAGPSN